MTFIGALQSQRRPPSASCLGLHSQDSCGRLLHVLIHIILRSTTFLCPFFLLTNFPLSSLDQVSKSLGQRTHSPRDPHCLSDGKDYSYLHTLQSHFLFTVRCSLTVETSPSAAAILPGHRTRPRNESHYFWSPSQHRHDCTWTVNERKTEFSPIKATPLLSLTDLAQMMSALGR